MRKHIVSIAIALASLQTWNITPSYGQLLFNPAGKTEQGSSEGTLGLGFFKADYESTLEGIKSTGYIERKFLFGSLAFGLNDSVDVIIGGAFSYKVETEDFAADDSGYILGGGLRAKLWHEKQNAVHLYSQLNYIDEEYGTEPETATLFAVESSSSGLELILGLLFVHTGENFKLYGGVELIPYSDIDFDVRIYGTDRRGFMDVTEKLDVERDDIFSIKLGGLFDIGNADLLADVTLIGERTFRVGISKTF